MNPGQAPPPNLPSTAAPRRHWSRRKHLAVLLVTLLLVYFGVTYLAVPALWERYAHRHPQLEDVPGITYTGAGIPGDPLNVALIGTKSEVTKALQAAGWQPADPLGLRSDLEIAEATVLRRAYQRAPVSSLYLFGRKEDLAFEQAIGGDPRKRHHVRFWRARKNDPDDRPVWVGSATHDTRVGFSHTTGQITHHIAADVDAERDHLFATLEKAGQLAESYAVDGFHKTLHGRNGGGDPWFTDGRLFVGVIALTRTR